MKAKTNKKQFSVKKHNELLAELYTRNTNIEDFKNVNIKLYKTGEIKELTHMNSSSKKAFDGEMYFNIEALKEQCLKYSATLVRIADKRLDLKINELEASVYVTSFAEQTFRHHIKNCILNCIDGGNRKGALKC